MLVPGSGRRITRDRALVAQAAGHAVQCILGDAADLDAHAPCLLFKLGDARVLAAGFKQDFPDIVGVVLDGGGHGVESDDPLGGFIHAHIVPCSSP